VIDRGFDIWVVPIGGSNVDKGWIRRGINLPRLAQHYHFDHLGASGAVIGSEGVVRVARNDTPAEKPVHSMVEVLARVDIGERYTG